VSFPDPSSSVLEVTLSDTLAASSTNSVALWVIEVPGFYRGRSDHTSGSAALILMFFVDHDVLSEHRTEYSLNMIHVVIGVVCTDEGYFCCWSKR